MAKLVSGRLKAQAPAGPHPGPELLAAFAENALPEADRGLLLQHLGVCSDCREILYLALPDSPETQKVFLPQPRPFTFRRWALGWGALVASVVIVFFATNHLGHRNQPAPMVATAPAAKSENEAKIAADKAPQELDQLQAAHDALKPHSVKPKMAVALAKSEPHSQPEAKHMTAKPQANLDFDESGQVRVGVLPGPAAPNPVPEKPNQTEAVQRTDSPIQNLPLRGRDATTLGALTASGGQPTSPRQPTSSSAADKNAIGYAYSRPDLLAKRSATKGNLGGMVLDPAGAVVANAKVTVSGPGGQKVVTSDQDGKFSFDPLFPGSYLVKAEASGFKPTEIKQVAVLDDKAAALQVRLEPGSASEVVQVNGAAPAVAEVSATSAEATGASAGFVAQPQATTELLSRQQAAAPSSRGKDGMAAFEMTSPALQWTLSPEGAVQRSGDSGKTWQPVSVAPGATFLALSAGGANIWVGGKAGALYHSADYGQTWLKCEAAVGSRKLDQDIVRVDFSNALNGAVNTANGDVWMTSDSGKTWQLK